MLGHFCPLAVVGERLGLLGAKPPMQQGSGCVERSPGNVLLIVCLQVCHSGCMHCAVGQ